MHCDVLLTLLLVAQLGEPRPAPAEPLPPLTALVTRVEGRATAEGPDGRLLALEPGRVLPGDWRVSVPAGATVALVCSSDRRAGIGAAPGGGSVEVVTAAACAAGEPLLPATYRALARGDRDLSLERSGEVRFRILMARTRGSEEDDPRIPVLLSPRETAVTEARPEIRWTAVADAEEYVVRLVGPDHWTARLPAAEVPCKVEAHPPGAVEVCATAWPADTPGLEPASSYFLAVGARTGLAGPVRESEPRRLRFLSSDATGIHASLTALRELGLPPHEEAFRTALLLADHGLRSAAAATVRRSLVESPSAGAFLLQGSLELEVLLPRAALRSFEEAGRLADDPILATEAREGVLAALRLLGETP